MAENDFLNESGEAEREYTFRFKMPRLPKLPKMGDMPKPNLIPDEVAGHMKAAQREQLLAVRSFLDAMLEKLDGGSSDSSKSERVEVN